MAGLDRHARLQASTALTSASVTTLALRGKIFAHACTRVNLYRLANNQAVLQQLPDVETAIRHADLARLVRVQPDAFLTAPQQRANKRPPKPAYAKATRRCTVRAGKHDGTQMNDRSLTIEDLHLENN